jgi:agmatine/peptidylarginine deiminase
VTLHDHVVNSAWIRDWGPLQAREADGSMVWLDAEYSTMRPEDDGAPTFLASEYGAPLQALPVLLDGGALASNGEGICVSTREFFDKWDINRKDIAVLSVELGCRHILLVPALRSEETKHVDLFLQFVEPNVVTLAAFDPDEAKADAKRMEQVASILFEAAQVLDWQLTIHRVPLPKKQARDRYFAYTNYFRLPHLVLVPHYIDVDPAVEAEAYEAIAQAIPSADIVPIPADDLLEYGGSIHCLTLGLSGSPGLGKIVARRPKPSRLLKKQPAKRASRRRRGG